MPAAGAGRRFGPAVPKQYASLAGRTVIEWALRPFVGDPRCAGIVVAISPDDTHWPHIASRLPSIRTAPGGAERSHSVRNGLLALSALAADEDWVLVHDAARPCLTPEDLDRLWTRLSSHPVGGLLATPTADTLKRSDGADVAETVDRSELWRALTPQMFRYGALCKALDAAVASGRSPTDESQAIEWQGAAPQLVEGATSNIKITRAEDLLVAEAALSGAKKMIRVGSGTDVHTFGPGDYVMLGGVRIPHSHGVVAHSDGDVVLHALCDALLGAAGLGDIGQHFRDDDPQWKGADSKRFVTAVLGMLKAGNLRVCNADITVLSEAPRISRHRDDMRRTVAGLLEVDVLQVNIKATTTEKLGFIGRGEGLAAQASVLLESAPTP